MQNRWEVGPALNVARRDFGFVFDGCCLLAIGGEGNGQRLSSTIYFLLLKFNYFVSYHYNLGPLTVWKFFTWVTSALNGKYPSPNGCHTFLDESKRSLYRTNFMIRADLLIYS